MAAGYCHALSRRIALGRGKAPSPSDIMQQSPCRGPTSPSSRRRCAAQDRGDFETWPRPDSFPDLHGGAADGQAVGPPFTSADVTPQPACAILQQVRLLHEYV